MLVNDIPLWIRHYVLHADGVSVLVTNPYNLAYCTIFSPRPTSLYLCRCAIRILNDFLSLLRLAFLPLLSLTLSRL